MTRMMIAAGLAAVTLAGCQSTCRKPSCSRCTPAPIVYSSPAPTAGPGEILFERPPATAPVAPPQPIQNLPPAPAPTFPEQPRASGYTPAKIDNPSRVANVPSEVQFEKPEFSETNRREIASMKPVAATSASNATFRELIGGKLAIGPKPSLDDIDRLAHAGYKRVVSVGGTVSETDRRVFASRGLAIDSGEAAPRVSEPTYVYASDPKLVRGWCVRYLRETEFVSSEAAVIRVDRALR